MSKIAWCVILQTMAKLKLKKLLKRASPYTSFNFESFFGFALESVEKGESAKMGFQFNVKDQYVDSETKTLMIQHTLDDYIYPEIMHRVHNGILPPSYRPTLVHMLLSTRSSRNKIFLDNETHFSANIVLKCDRDLKDNEPIKVDEIKEITRIFPNENFASDYAHIMLIKFNGKWLGCIDLTFDRLKIKRKMKSAREFLKSAKHDLKHQYWSPFITSIWRSTELSVQSLLLFRFQGSFSTHQDHNETKKRFKAFYKQTNVPNKFWTHYHYLFRNYKFGSYAQGINKDFAIDEQTAQELLTTSEEMLCYVIKILEMVDQNRKPSGKIAIKLSACN